MSSINKKSILVLVIAFALVWLGIKYLLPVVLPFFLGALLALAAEPVVRFLSRKLPRAAAAAIGVAATLVLLTCIILLLMALLVREIGLLANALPDLGQAALGGLQSLEHFLLELADKTPTGIRSLLSQAVTGMFSSGSAIVGQLLQRLPALASALLGWIPGSALALGTGILSGFMVSARLPRIRDWLRSRQPGAFLGQYLPVLRQVRAALVGWLKAQLKLIGLSFLIICSGLLLLRVPYAPIWALLIALVDAVPILGTGTVLLPWSLVCLLQGQSARAIGLLGTYLVAMLSRSVFEPRLVGKQLGLDPLVTLIALYAGFQIWGIGGMLISPVICVAAAELLRARA